MKMKFAVKFPKGWLYRSVNSKKKRKLVEYLAEASFWETIGAAKLAVKAACDSKQIKLKKDEKVVIFPISIQALSEFAISYDPRKKNKK